MLFERLTLYQAGEGYHEGRIPALEYPESFPDPTMFGLMKEYWEDVGLKILVEGELAWALFGQRTAALDHMIMVHAYQTVGEIAFLVEPFRPRVHGVKEAPAWATWMNADRDVNRHTARLLHLHRYRATWAPRRWPTSRFRPSRCGWR